MLDICKTFSPIRSSLLVTKIDLFKLIIVSNKGFELYKSLILISLIPVPSDAWLRDFPRTHNQVTPSPCICARFSLETNLSWLHCETIRNKLWWSQSLLFGRFRRAIPSCRFSRVKRIQFNSLSLVKINSSA